jgi:Putative transposase of IS4/5 family (DUF4096)/Transport and Golgi organisation 2
MGTVIISLEPSSPTMLLMGIRDEAPGRPWLPPAWHWPELPLIGGRDELAGGTWLAVHPAIPRVACCCPGGISRSTRVPRYPSDMSDAEWQVIEPTLPAPAWKAGKGGRPAERCRRDDVDAIRYLVKESIQWRAMPAGLTRYVA